MSDQKRSFWLSPQRLTALGFRFYWCRQLFFANRVSSTSVCMVTIFDFSAMPLNAYFYARWA